MNKEMPRPEELKAIQKQHMTEGEVKDWWKEKPYWIKGIVSGSIYFALLLLLSVFFLDELKWAEPIHYMYILFCLIIIGILTFWIIQNIDKWILKIMVVLNKIIPFIHKFDEKDKENLKIPSNKNFISRLLDKNFVIFNLIVILITFIPVIIYHLWFSLTYKDYGYVGRFFIDREAVTEIYLLMFGLFNVVRFNKLGKKLPIFLITTIVPLLMVFGTKFIGSCSSCDMEEMIFDYTFIFLPIALFCYYIISEKMHILSKILLICMLIPLFFFVGEIVGLITGFFSIGF